jgi:hypothetical protein
MVHASVAAIAQACVSDPEDRLVELLVEAIELLERLQPVIVSSRTEQLQPA